MGLPLDGYIRVSRVGAGRLQRLEDGVEHDPLDPPTDWQRWLPYSWLPRTHE